MSDLGRILSLAFISLLFSCKKEQKFKSSGQVTGVNLGYCVTCGGIYVKLEGDTTTKYLIQYTENLNAVIATLRSDYLRDSIAIPISIDWTSVDATQPDAPPNWIRATALKENK